MMKIEKLFLALFAIDVLHLRMVWATVLIAICAMLMYTSTFGIGMHLYYLVEHDASWLTVVVAVLGILFAALIFGEIRNKPQGKYIQEGERFVNLFLSGFILTLLALVSAPICGTGLVIPGLFIPGFFEVLKGWSGELHDGLSPALAWRAGLVILATYTALGIIFQTTGTVIVLIERMFRRKWVGIRYKMAFWFSILGMLAYLVFVRPGI